MISIIILNYAKSEPHSGEPHIGEKQIKGKPQYQSLNIRMTFVVMLEQFCFMLLHRRQNWNHHVEIRSEYW